MKDPVIAPAGVPAPTFPGWPRRLWCWASGLFLVSLLLYAVVAASLYLREEPSGDEPPYLLLAHSIVFDGDVDLRNNMEAQDYRHFFHDPAVAWCEPAFDMRGDGTWRSMHGVGLPLLLALPYGLAGRLGANLAIAALAAILPTALFLIAERVSKSSGAALVTAGLVGFTLPVLPYAGKVFPDVPAAALILVALYLILRSEPPGRGWMLLCGAVLAFLPWLHTRLWLVAGVLLCWALLRLKAARSWRSLLHAAVPLLLPVVLSLALQIFFFQRWYGSPWPNAPYRISLGWPWFVFHPSHVYQGVVGLFLDQEFGLLFYAPFYTAALAGLVVLFRRRRDLFLVIGACLGGLTLLAAVFIMWWGGDSGPARLIIPAVPLLGIPLAVVLPRWRHWGFRLPLAILILLSLLMASLHIIHLEWLHCEDDDRTARIFQELGMERLAPLFPATAVRTILYGAHGLPFQAGEVQAFEGKKVVYAGPQDPAGSWVQQLPLRLPRGEYRIRPRMRVLPLNAEPAASLAVLRVTSPEGQLLLERTLTPADLPAEVTFHDFDLALDNSALTSVIFWVYFTGEAALWLESTTVGPAPVLVDGGKVIGWVIVLAVLIGAWNYLGRRTTFENQER